MMTQNYRVCQTYHLVERMEKNKDIFSLFRNVIQSTNQLHWGSTLYICFHEVESQRKLSQHWKSRSSMHLRRLHPTAQLYQSDLPWRETEHRTQTVKLARRSPIIQSINLYKETREPFGYEIHKGFEKDPAKRTWTESSQHKEQPLQVIKTETWKKGRAQTFTYLSLHKCGLLPES